MQELEVQKNDPTWQEISMVLWRNNKISRGKAMVSHELSTSFATSPKIFKQEIFSRLHLFADM